MDPFAGRRLVTITEADLDGLIQRADSESLHLEYKQELDIDDTNDQRQRNRRQGFLKDVTAFANSGGGLLIYGVEEERDANGKPTGIPSQICGIDCANVGQLKQKIEGIISGGVDEPPYGPLEMEGVLLKTGKYVLLIRVPMSLRAPHMVKLGGEQRFYRRINTGVEPMTASQIRDVALQSASIEERTAAQIKRRCSSLSQQHKGPFTVLHVVPLLQKPRLLDVTLTQTIARLKKAPFFGRQRHDLPDVGRHVLFGYEVSIRPNNQLWAYALFRRNGITEFFNAYAIVQNDGIYRYEYIENDIHESLAFAMSLYHDLLPLPAAVSVSLENVSLISWPDWSHFEVRKGGPLNLPNITPEPIVITELRDDYRPLMKPIWDVIWNAGGQQKCEGYDDNGNYVSYGQMRRR